MVYVVHRPQIFKVDRLRNTLAYELASKVVSLIVSTPKEFVHQFNMARKIAGETSRSVILYATFGASARFPKKAFENDDHNDFVVPESYYSHRTTRSVRVVRAIITRILNSRFALEHRYVKSWIPTPSKDLTSREVMFKRSQFSQAVVSPPFSSLTRSPRQRPRKRKVRVRSISFSSV